jgi:diadenosine tetraphosphate (Ap4A) HIT family hydrolase
MSLMPADPDDRALCGSACPFCNLPPQRILRMGELCLASADAYPVSPGHTLIIPRRHVASFFDTTAEEKRELFELLAWCREELLARCQPAGFNIGINDGAAAGQTVMHVHIHLIPRYAGDKADPRGGVRWIFPEKADYWSRK